MSIATTVPATVSRNLGLVDRCARALVRRRLNGQMLGALTVVDADESMTFGASPDPAASIRVHNSRFYRQLLLGGALGAAESFLRGDWDCDHLTELFRFFIRNETAAGNLDRGQAPVLNLGRRLHHWWRSNDRAGSSRNIRAHYDLGNEFFRLWLDETLAYSCGLFASPADTMRDASVNKFDRVCRLLDLQPGDHLLEIGCGWGGLAIHAADRYGCRVTAATISPAQFELAQARVREAGVQHRVRLILQDYRELRGTYDKIASIEMIEAVGHNYLDRYFGQCSKLLAAHGSMVLQAIVIPDQRHAAYLRSVDFIQHYVFPGGCLPSVGSIAAAVGRATDLRWVRADDFADHYAETLRRWRASFVERLDDVRAAGFAEEFIRLWLYYLSYCEAVFEERYCGLLQIQLDKPRRRGVSAVAQTAEKPNLASCPSEV